MEKVQGNIVKLICIHLRFPTCYPMQYFSGVQQNYERIDSYATRLLYAFKRTAIYSDPQTYDEGIIFAKKQKILNVKSRKLSANKNSCKEKNNTKFKKNSSASIKYIPNTN